jgi:hypothetical protein
LLRTFSPILAIVSVSLLIPSAAFAATGATMISPKPGTVLSGTTVKFTWTKGSGLYAYGLAVGTTRGSANIYDAELKRTYTTVEHIPANGKTIYVKLSSKASSTGAWSSHSYTYTASRGTTSISVSVSPKTATINTGATLGLTATVSGSTNKGVTWSVTGGSITGSGDSATYKAPSTAGTYTVKATSEADKSKSGTATITVHAPTQVGVSINPQTASLAVGGTKSFTASVTGSSNTAVNWSTTGGTISGTGSTVTYKAPSTAGTYTVKATSAADKSKSGTATITVHASTQVGISLNPQTASLTVGGTQSFTASVTGSSNTAVNWSTTGGTISGTGTTVSYKAPSSAGTYSVKATSAADSSKSASATVTVAASTSSVSCAPMALGQGASLNGVRPFPASNAWNQDISSAAVDSNSTTIINYIGAGVALHPDFGAGLYDGTTMGIPYVIVDSSQANVNLAVANPAQSDIPPMPIPSNAPIEGYPNGGDNHVLVLDKSNCFEYDLYQGAYSGGSWSASSSAIWDLQNGETRPYTWSSADAAGLPIFPGLIRYDEVANGAINHAIRFTVPYTKAAFVSPATHWAPTNAGAPIPLGIRLRLKASFDVSGFSATNQIILNAMKKYGLLLADNGSAIYITGTPDSRWNNDDLHLLGQVTGSDFEVVSMGTVYTASNIPQGNAPSISSLSASSSSVSPGAAVTLNWNVSGASYLYISPVVGPVRGNSVTFAPTQTATYTLTATNQYGRSTATVTVNVQ